MCMCMCLCMCMCTHTCCLSNTVNCRGHARLGKHWWDGVLMLIVCVSLSRRPHSVDSPCHRTTKYFAFFTHAHIYIYIHTYFVLSPFYIASRMISHYLWFTFCGCETLVVRLHPHPVHPILPRPPPSSLIHSTLLCLIPLLACGGRAPALRRGQPCSSRSAEPCGGCNTII